jgi:hypothetical protein
MKISSAAGEFSKNKHQKIKFFLFLSAKYANKSPKNLFFKSIPVDDNNQPQMNFVCHKQINSSAADEFKNGFFLGVVCVLAN